MLVVINEIGDDLLLAFGREPLIADAADKAAPDLRIGVRVALNVVIQRGDEIDGELLHALLAERGDVFVHLARGELFFILVGKVPQELEPHGGNQHHDERVDYHAEEEAQPLAFLFHPSAPSCNTRIEVGTGRIPITEAVLLI